jgi:hypothetical protein
MIDNRKKQSVRRRGGRVTGKPKDGDLSISGVVHSTYVSAILY